MQIIEPGGSATADTTDRDHLAAELIRLGNALDRLAGVEPRPVPTPSRQRESAAERLRRLFGLSDFERDVLVAVAGTELDADFARRCAAAQQHMTETRMTLSLALAAFGNGHMNAVAPSSALRRHGLITFPDGATPLLAAPLGVDERVLCYLLGVDTIDPRIDDVMTELSPDHELGPTREREVDRVVAAHARYGGRLTAAITGVTAGEREAVGGAAVARLGLRLFRLRAADLPTDPGARKRLRRLWEREALLAEAALWLEVDPDAAPETLRAATAFADEIAGFAMIASRDPLPIARDAFIGVHLRDEPDDERHARWRRQLGPVADELDGALDRVAAQFQLSPSSLSRARLSIDDGDAPITDRLWDACRAQARPRLDELARRVEPFATWNDLVTSNENLVALHQIVSHLRQRFEVYQRWGFGRHANRGLGTGALFAGPSGTGKTLAAEVVAREARLDLYHIDLSQVVNKYIGETEKNLRRVFDAAEEGGAILLFDEADAVFGKRGDVEKGTDRYANLEISYLLQRMETYRGLSILTTNQRSAVDSAFLRRLKFVVPFAFPDAAQRVELWRRVFPPSAPLASLDYRKLARLQLPGGNIRNIAVNAAFAAADARQPISMVLLLEAARAEFKKIDKPFPENEVADWPG